MKPIKYKVINGVTHFYYDPKEYFDWRKRGMEFGDSGMILKKREGGFETWKSFGVIEGPCKTPIFISKMHFPPFDGRFCTDDEIIAPYPENSESNTESYRMVIMDLNEPKKEEEAELQKLSDFMEAQIIKMKSILTNRENPPVFTPEPLVGSYKIDIIQSEFVTEGKPKLFVHPNDYERLLENL